MHKLYFSVESLPGENPAAGVGLVRCLRQLPSSTVRSRLLMTGPVFFENVKFVHFLVSLLRVKRKHYSMTQTLSTTLSKEYGPLVERVACVMCDHFTVSVLWFVCVLCMHITKCSVRCCLCSSWWFASRRQYPGSRAGLGGPIR